MQTSLAYLASSAFSRVEASTGFTPRHTIWLSQRQIIQGSKAVLSTHSPGREVSDQTANVESRKDEENPCGKKLLIVQVSLLAVLNAPKVVLLLLVEVLHKHVQIHSHHLDLLEGTMLSIF